jgi:hypothetical protein
MQSNNNQRVKKYYVYGHYTNEDKLFYIGVGTILNLKSKTHTQRYSRAYHSKSKTALWKNVREKHGLKVKILFEYFTKRESLEKEKELIEKFGRRVMKEGYLTNISTGGEIGPVGRIFKMSKEQKQYLSKIKSTTLYVYDKLGKFLTEIETIKNTAKYCGVTYNAIHSCLQTKNYSNGYFIFKEFKGDTLDYTYENLDFKSKLSKKVITRSSVNGLCITHLSLKDASVYLKTDRSNLRKAIKDNRLCKKHYVRFL